MKNRVVTKYTDYEKLIKGYLRSERVLKERGHEYTINIEFDKEKDLSYIIIDLIDGEQRKKNIEEPPAE